MLAITLALLASAQLGTPPIRSQQPPAVTASAAAGAQVAAFTPQFSPQGLATGIWTSGTLLQDGYLSATMVDADEQPIYTLTAQVHASGDVSGKLVVLEYASNPALNLPEFAVVGEVELPTAERAGKLALVIYNPLEDIGYVFPRGYIDGVLTEGAVRMVKPGQTQQNLGLGGMQAPGHGGNAADRAGVQLRGQIISCPWAPESSQAAEMAPAKQSVRRNGMIVCPFEPKTTVKAKTALGAASATGHAPVGSVKIEVGATALGSTGAASGHQAPTLKSGKMVARWTLLL
jgi:hypothetical protein